MKKLISLLLIVLALSLVSLALVSCGDDSQTATTTPAVTTGGGGPAGEIMCCGIRRKHAPNDTISPPHPQ